MKRKIILLILLLSASYSLINAQNPVGAKLLPLPTPAQRMWQETERAMFVHFDPAAWQGTEYDNHTTPLEKINPSKLDVNQWINVAESWGARIIVFVAKHAGGFCWWQTETTDYSIKNTSYRNGQGDVLSDLAAACRDRGMKLGIYIYPGDESWGAYLGGGGRTRDPAKQEAYNQVLRRQWTEVLTRVPDVTEIWFDGSVVVPLEDIIRSHAPDAIVFQGPFADIRWVGNEGGYAPYPLWNTLRCSDAATGTSTAAHGDPSGDCWMPVEVDVPLKNHNWFWSPENHRNLRSLDELMTIYYKSVGRGAQLLLNASPDTSGLIPAEDVALYKAFGDEISRRFGQSLAETSGKGNNLHLDPGREILIDHLVIREDLSFGQRIHRYVAEGRNGNDWFVIASGLSVGQHRIEQFSPVKVREIRLRVTESALPAVISKLAVFYVGDPNMRNAADPVRDDMGNLWIRGQRSAAALDTLLPVQAENKTSAGLFTADLSAVISLPGQYRISAEHITTGHKVPLTEAILILKGIETPGLASLSDDGLSCILNITAFPLKDPGSIAFRAKAGTELSGDFLLHMQEIRID